MEVVILREDVSFSLGDLAPPPTNKTDGHDITEILMKVVLNSITSNLSLSCTGYHALKSSAIKFTLYILIFHVTRLFV